MKRKFVITLTEQDFLYLRRTFKACRALGYASRLDDADAGVLFAGDSLLQGAAGIYANQRSKHTGPESD